MYYARQTDILMRKSPLEFRSVLEAMLSTSLTWLIYHYQSEAVTTEKGEA